MLKEAEPHPSVHIHSRSPCYQVLPGWLDTSSSTACAPRRRTRLATHGQRPRARGPCLTVTPAPSQAAGARARCMAASPSLARMSPKNTEVGPGKQGKIYHPSNTR